jgi:large subunit ribosomal protein L9
MKVLLRSDVDGVGRRGDIVEVSGGFARNYLVPTGRAVDAPAGVALQAAAMRRSRDLRDAKDRDAASTVAEVLGSKPVVVTARAGAEGRLFGSVTSTDLAEAIEAQTGAVVDRRRIALSEPIRSIGTHTVTVRLHSDVDAQVVVEVTPIG